ncbi:MAG: DUF4124 domain-containing protein [Gammaproteobacteria bacterium]|nr:DUF4124 domain-containing protein [Gammaproteobacteria bacterium]
MRLFLLFISLTLISLETKAGTVYKCTDNTGHLLYSSQPCPNQKKQVAKLWMNDSSAKDNAGSKDNAAIKQNTAMLLARANASDSDRVYYHYNIRRNMDVQGINEKFKNAENDMRWNGSRSDQNTLDNRISTMENARKIITGTP